MENPDNADNSAQPREPWNKGKLIGQTPPLRPKHVWSIRTKLQIEGRTRDLAMFNLAIAIYRPILLAARKVPALSNSTSRLWITQFGTPPTPEGFAQIICIETAKAFGKPVPPHFFRDSAMTSWAMDLPKQIRAGKHLLGNRSFTVIESAYNMAGSSDAAVKLQQIIESVQQDARRREPSVRPQQPRAKRRQL